jgi:O-antigen ligase
VPAVTFLYSAEAYRAAWLPESARHRIVIWRYTSEQIAKAPFLGAGIATARAMNEAVEEAGDAGARRVPGTRFHLSTSLHSHNAYLQVWYEAGAMGMLLMLGLGLIVLRALTRTPAQAQPYLVATFAACALLAASAYSIWAPWFMASLAMASLFAVLGAALPGRQAPLRRSDRSGTLAVATASSAPTRQPLQLGEQRCHHGRAASQRRNGVADRGERQRRQGGVGERGADHHA